MKMLCKFIYIIQAVLWCLQKHCSVYAADGSAGVLIPGLKSITNHVNFGWMKSPNLLYCSSLECLDKFAGGYSDSMSQANNTVIFAFFTSDLESDALMNLFFQWVYDVFSSKRYDPIFLILETEPMIQHMPMGADASLMIDSLFAVAAYDEESLMRYIISRLPRNTVFGITHCNSWSSGLHPAGLVSYRKSLGHYTNIFIHLNHEQPYSSVANPQHFFDHCYGTPFAVFNTYKQFDLVIRYFYFDIYHLPNVRFLPLGPQVYFTLRNLKMELGVKKASQRSVHCHFSGRFTYGRSGPHERERNQILAMVNASVFPCSSLQSSTSDAAAQPKLHYRDYVILMADVVFAPAPAGNVGETFRLFEALELGAIPLVAKQSDHMDFMSLPEWSGFPAPRFSSFEDIRPYFAFLEALRRGDSLPCRAVLDLQNDLFHSDLFESDGTDRRFTFDSDSDWDTYDNSLGKVTAATMAKLIVRNAHHSGKDRLKAGGYWAQLAVRVCETWLEFDSSTNKGSDDQVRVKRSASLWPSLSLSHLPSDIAIKTAAAKTTTTTSSSHDNSCASPSMAQHSHAAFVNDGSGLKSSSDNGSATGCKRASSALFDLYVDTLQARTIAWYAAFKRDLSDGLVDAILHTFWPPTPST